MIWGWIEERGGGVGVWVGGLGVEVGDGVG